jgi:predicted nucleic acid-binding protein
MVIIDASVAVKWVVDEPDGDKAEKLLSQRLAAPALWLAEAASALWSKHRRQDISEDEVRGACVTLRQAPVLQLSLDPLLPAAIDYALTLQHPVYDCFYLAAAHLHDTHLVTADLRFARRMASHPDHAVRVRLLANLTI